MSFVPSYPYLRNIWKSFLPTFWNRISTHARHGTIEPARLLWTNVRKSDVVIVKCFLCALKHFYIFRKICITVNKTHRQANRVGVQKSHFIQPCYELHAFAIYLVCETFPAKQVPRTFPGVDFVCSAFLSPPPSAGYQFVSLIRFI